MDIRIFKLAALGFLFAAGAAAGDAPANVGALLDGGGKQLTKGEILKLFAGATIEGTAMGSPDSKFRLSYGPDGSAAGEGWSPRGSTKITGTWSANEQNQYCQDLKTAEGNAIRGCFYYFRLGNQLYAAPADARNAPVFERKLAANPPANPPAAAADTERTAAALGSWLIGDRLSLAAIVYGRGGAQDFIDGQLSGAKQVAQSLGVAIPPFPQGDKRMVEVIQYLIKGDGAQLGLALGNKYEPRDTLLFELAVKSNLAMILYEPNDASAFPEVIRTRSESIGLPPELWNPVVAAMLDKKPEDEVKHLIIEMHEKVAQYLKQAVKS